jgi:hypothetical protein
LTQRAARAENFSTAHAAGINRGKFRKNLRRSVKIFNVLRSLRLVNGPPQ